MACLVLPPSLSEQVIAIFFWSRTSNEILGLLWQKVERLSKFLCISWPFCGHNEIQEPRRKDVQINYQKLRELLGFDSYEEVARYHRSWVETYLGNDKNIRDDKWTTSIAVGDKSFVEKIRSLMGVMAIGRKSNEAGDVYQLREPAAPYMAHFGGKKSDIGPKNTYSWKYNPYNSIG